MDAYVASGGGYTEQTPTALRQEVNDARSGSAELSQTPHAVQPCPDGEGPDVSGFAPPATVCSCILSALSVSCSHGRRAQSDFLQIVPDEIGAGDPLSIVPEAGGDCATKLVIRTRNFEGPSESHGPAPITRILSGPGSAQPGGWGWWKATPRRGTVEATTCGGNPVVIDVERFPAGESKIQLNLSKVLEGFMNGFGKLPVDLRLFTTKGTPRKIRRQGEAKAEDFTLDGLKKRIKNNNNAKVGAPAEIVWQLASAWREEKGSHLVYCEIVSILAADPLFEAKFSILLYGIPIPGTFRKYVDVAAGIYLNADGKITLGGQVAGKRYPAPTDRWAWAEVSGNLSGSLKLELALELCVFSPKVLQAKGGGSFNAKAAGNFRNEFDSKIWLDYEVKAGKLTATVIFKTLWGLVEYEREWQICDGWNDGDSFEVLDFGA